MSYETHYARYKELNETYKIANSRYALLSREERAGLTLLEAVDAENKAMEKFDVVVECIGNVYAGVKYKVLRNKPGLNTRDLAIICDKGNLCFGYRADSDCIVVYID